MTSLYKDPTDKILLVRYTEVGKMEVVTLYEGPALDGPSVTDLQESVNGIVGELGGPGPIILAAPKERANVRRDS